MDTPSTICPTCGEENPRLAWTCRRCQKSLVRRSVPCPTCGREARRTDDFCKYCGGKLPPEPEPIVPLYPTTVQGWRHRLLRYPFYARLWRAGGAGDRHLTACLQACAPGFPPGLTARQVFEACPIVIPILPRDWCIWRLTWQQGDDEDPGREQAASSSERREVLHGVLICAPDRFILLDLDARRTSMFPYSLIRHTLFDIYWTYKIGLTTDEVLRLAIKHDGGQVALFRSSAELLADRAGDSGHIIGRYIRMPPRYRGDERSRNAGTAFWNDFLLFLVQVSGFFRAAA